MKKIKYTILILLAFLIARAIIGKINETKAHRYAETIVTESATIDSKLDLIDSIVSIYENCTFIEEKAPDRVIFSHRHSEDTTSLGRLLDTISADLDGYIHSDTVFPHHWNTDAGKFMFFSPHHKESNSFNNDDRIWEFPDWEGFRRLTDRNGLYEEYIGTLKKSVFTWHTAKQQLAEDTNTINRLKDLRYFAVITYDYYLHPKSHATYFTGGYVRATLNIYNLENPSAKPIHQQKLYAESSSMIAHAGLCIHQQKLDSDLADNLSLEIKKAICNFVEKFH